MSVPIAPADLGRQYREVIRVNSQSGKGGVAYLLESEFVIELPKEMQREFRPLANDSVDRLGLEVSATELKDIFWREYIERTAPLALEHFHAEGRAGVFRCDARRKRGTDTLELSGEGNGPIAALVHALGKAGVPPCEVAYYREHALGSGAEASAIAYIQIRLADGRTRWGAGEDTHIELASVKAVLSALNRALPKPKHRSERERSFSRGAARPAKKALSSSGGVTPFGDGPGRGLEVVCSLSSDERERGVANEFFLLPPAAKRAHHHRYAFFCFCDVAGRAGVFAGH